MTQKPLLILNRKSGARTDIRALIRSLERELGFDVIIPWSGRQLRKAVSKHVSKGGKRIIAGGGDGTLNFVANAILRLGANKDVEMGIVPLGTANDFARGFGDDGSDLDRSIRHAMFGTPAPMDVGVVNGKNFINVASGGFGAMITATTHPEIKKRLGGLAYSLSGLARISELSPYVAQISLDGDEPKKLSVLALAIGNNRYAGGGFDVAPDAKVDDGLLDISVLASDLPLRNPGATSSSATSPFQFARFRTARIQTERPFHLNLDGEPLADTVFDVSIRPAALQVILPVAD